MNERLCFVQFMHPGKEHGFDADGFRSWNRDRAHRRKFLRADGAYVDGASNVRSDLVFWGEWEPPSRVDPIASPTRYGPRFVHVPLLPARVEPEWRQNTDPFVFGDRFAYTGCMQHTRFGPTQLRFLAPGSVILFGSARERSQFALDTVFVVDEWIDHTADDYHRLAGIVDPGYWRATIEPWYSASLPADRSHRLYFGATADKPRHGMFSFFPARTAAEAPNGFERPVIELHEITPTLTQGKRLNPQRSLDDVRRLWESVVMQVVERDALRLGVHAEMPGVT